MRTHSGNTLYRRAALASAAGLMLLTVVAASPAHAVTLLVANNGTDSGSCGLDPNPPCRSITQAIANATAGATIVVGPGVYGDLDDSGTIGDSAGEETPSLGHMVAITKALTIVSRDGAGVTLLDAAGTALNVVGITADGVKLGKKNNGFTLRRGVFGLQVAANGAKVTGNVAEENSSDGFFVAFVSGTVLSTNIATNNAISGFTNIGGDTVLKGNLARSNGAGFFVAGPATGVSVTKNIAIGNEHGFDISFSDDAATLPVATFSGNAALGNRTSGVLVNMSGTFTADAAPLTLLRNNFYGNGRGALYVPGNCAVSLYIDDSTPPANTLTVNSLSDYYGGPGGPGGNPKDDNGNSDPNCNTASSGTIVQSTSSPASKEYRVRAPGIR